MITKTNAPTQKPTAPVLGACAGPVAPRWPFRTVAVTEILDRNATAKTVEIAMGAAMTGDPCGTTSSRRTGSADARQPDQSTKPPVRPPCLTSPRRAAT
jgi:hypothetical protein